MVSVCRLPGLFVSFSPDLSLVVVEAMTLSRGCFGSMQGQFLFLHQILLWQLMFWR